MATFTKAEAIEYANTHFVKPIQCHFRTEAEAIDFMNNENLRPNRIAEHSRVFEYEGGYIMEYLGDFRYYDMGNKILKGQVIRTPKATA